LENKKKKRNPLPPSWAESSPCRGRFPPSRPRLPPLGPFPACFHARQPALRPLSLADEPTPPASRSLARSLPLADRPHRSAASSSSPRTTRRGHLRPSPPSPRPSPRRTGKLGTATSSPLDRVLARYRPRRAVSSSPLCGIKRRRCAPHRRPPSSAAPRPSGAYKRVAPSTSFPAPASATPLLPLPELNSRSAAVFSLSGKPFPLFPLPLWLRSKKLARPISFATPPRVWNATPLPQSPPRSSPAATPAAELRHLPADSPLPAPSSQIELALGSPAPPRAQAPNRCPRTGSPAANRRRAHRRPVHHAVDRSAVSPPSTLAGVWAPRRQRHPRAPVPSLALGRSWADATARPAGPVSPHGPPEA
jgi:hypothetical protein